MPSHEFEALFQQMLKRQIEPVRKSGFSVKALMVLLQTAGQEQTLLDIATAGKCSYKTASDVVLKARRQGMVVCRWRGRGPGSGAGGKTLMIRARSLQTEKAPGGRNTERLEENPHNIQSNGE